MAYGFKGYEDMLVRQIGVARVVAAFVPDSLDFELLPPRKGLSKSQLLERVYMLVLFWARDENLNRSLLKLINDSTYEYLSGAIWEEKPAVRLAVSNWRADVEREEQVLTRMLEDIVKGWKVIHGQDYLATKSQVMKRISKI